MGIQKRIKSINIKGNPIAWRIIQIKSLSANYKSFIDLRESLGLDNLQKGSYLNKADKVHFNDRNLLEAYSKLYPNYYFILKLINAFFISLFIISVFLIGLIFTNQQFIFFTTLILLLLILTFSLLIFIKKKPQNFSKLCFNDESIFCYLYSFEALYVEKFRAGIDTFSENIVFQETDFNVKLFTPLVVQENEFTPYLFKNKWGYLNQGKVLIDFQYDCDKESRFFDNRFSQFEGLALVHKNGLYGYIDKLGNLIIDFQYNEGRKFKDGIAVVVDTNNKYGAIDIRNNVIFEFIYDDIEHYHNDLYLVKSNGKFGILNSRNHKILDLIYLEIGEIVYDRATIEYKSKKNETSLYGYIDSSGKIVIEPKYEFAFNFVHDLAVVEKYIDYNDEEDLNNFFDNEEISGNYGVINKSGDTVFPFKYEEINIYETENFNTPGLLITACYFDQWGIIYLGGLNHFTNSKFLKIQEQFNHKFDEFSEDNILNNLGEGIIIEDFDLLKPVKKNGLYGFEDRFHNLIIPYKFDDCYPFDNGLTRVLKDGKMGVINLKGEVLVDLKYNDIWFWNGAVVAYNGKHFFYLDTDGKELATF